MHLLAISALGAWAVTGLFFFAIVMVLIHVGQDVRRRRIKHKLYDYSAE